MPLKLMYITNQPTIAKVAEDSGVDWIFIDLELNGKYERQGHLDTVISHHNIEDISKVKCVLTTSQLLVRVNPIYSNSKEEIDQVIESGADIVMLPLFRTKEEVKTFIDYVDGRSKTCLLCETKEAVENMDCILELQGIDYIHVGLNDLHLSYNRKFMFELLVDGTVETLCKKFNEQSIPYGFGGVAQLGQGALPAEHIVAEHYRLGSNMVILSRSFCDANKNDINQIRKTFKEGVSSIRGYEEQLTHFNEEFFEENYKILQSKVEKVVKALIPN